MSAFVYMLRCADGSYYVGSARGATLDTRLGEHQSGTLGGYTETRRPVELVFAQHFQQITDAIAAERRIKGWSRAKKDALIRSDWDEVSRLSKRPCALNKTTPIIVRLPQAALTDAPDISRVLRGSPPASTSA